MVDLDKVQSSNAQISTAYPEGLVAVFAGSTSGIGETSLREFARHAPKPRIYIIGRSQEACDRLDAELKQVNPAAQYIFIRSDVSLLRNVDDVCRQISSKETAINVLFMSQGTLNFTKRTEEGLNYLLGLSYFGRIRMARNLLPLLQRATGLRRVVSTLTGTKEGKIYEDDWQGDKGKVPMSGQRKHGATMMTLGLEALASLAPEVSFVHAFPGVVKTNIVRGDEGGLMKVVGYAFKAMSVVACGMYTPIEEVGERHLFYCTSARYPPRSGAGGGQGAPGVALPSGVSVARGVDGEPGSGVYSVDEHGESANAKVEELLADYRKSGTGERLWAYTESEWKRVTGSVSI
ncbi:Putative daunorubicin C-13 ketoreductase DnrU [Cytospora mali]|uniref:Daunorubicin C-13 ketoreductase DnrU n=1 Tax=Cytospora mali TaxID=578113 RepID=A0A194W696_CYTMA|nr:Putative daunorubicin C-13 ketoreductase DnrU [Valsa mali]